MEAFDIEEINVPYFELKGTGMFWLSGYQSLIIPFIRDTVKQRKILRDLVARGEHIVKINKQDEKYIVTEYLLSRKGGVETKLIECQTVNEVKRILP